MEGEQNEAGSCSFCGRSQREVAHLVAGPYANICDAVFSLRGVRSGPSARPSMSVGWSFRGSPLRGADSWACWGQCPPSRCCSAYSPRWRRPFALCPKGPCWRPWWRHTWYAPFHSSCSSPSWRETRGCSASWRRQPGALPERRWVASCYQGEVGRVSRLESWPPRRQSGLVGGLSNLGPRVREAGEQADEADEAFGGTVARMEAPPRAPHGQMEGRTGSQLIWKDPLSSLVAGS
jgi:hypothetical protein